MLGECLEKVIQKRPLIHNITNYVTVNDVANMVLACGGSPIMADDPGEVAEITAICSGLNINIGTLNQRKVQSMLLAGKKANELKRPVVLDPVGVGASKLRTETAETLMKEIKIAVIKGNISEIKTLAAGTGTTKGVDADITDEVTEENLEKTVAFMKALSLKKNCILAVTGKIDFVTDGYKCYVIRNGRSEMEKVTGTGCQLSGLMAAYITANQENMLEAAAAAVIVMGLSGEIAWENMQPQDGNATYRNRIIDAVYNMTAEVVEKGANYELY